MGTDKKKLQGTITQDVELEEINIEGCLLGLLQSLIREQKISSQNNSEQEKSEIKNIKRCAT